MLKYISALVAPVIIFAILGCADGDDNTSEIEEIPVNTSEADYTYLALGDSYTIGESVCSTCRFPIQLKEQIEERRKLNIEF